MRKNERLNGFVGRLKGKWSSLRQLLSGADGRSSGRVRRRLEPLQELEDRRLLSATPVGAEFRVNTYTPGAQQTFGRTTQAVAMNPANGNYVAVWSSQGQNGGGTYDVYFQRYNAAGVAQGSETLVDTPANGVNQQYANVAMNAAGNFVVTWSSQQGGHWNVYAQQYNAGGLAQGSPILVDASTNADQANSAVAMNAIGNFVVTWSGDQSGVWQVYARVFNSAGTAQSVPIPVTNAFTDQIDPDVAISGTGSFVITWAGSQLLGDWNVYGETFGSNNQPAGSIFQVNTTVSDNSFTAVAMDAGGNFTITWTGVQNGIENVYARSYLSNGAANGSVFQVGPTMGQRQVDSSVAFAGDGSPFFTWASQNQDGSGWGIYAQQFTPTGTSLGNEFQVNTYTAGDQAYPSIAGSANGHVAIVWSSDNQDGSSLGVYGQNFATSVFPGINVSGSTFLVSEDNSVVRINSSTGAIVANYPTGVANDGLTTGPDGSIYVSDYINNRILHYDAAGTFLASFGSANLSTPQGLAFGPDGNLYVTNADGAVDKFTPAGAFLGTFISAGSGGLTNAKGIVWDSDGNAYVSSYFNSEVIRYNGTTGAFLNVFATGSGGFEGLTFGPDSNLYVASYSDNTVYRYIGTDGTSLGAFVSGGNLNNPYGLSFDSAGNLDVSSRSSGAIQTFDGSTGAFLKTLAIGLSNPGDMTTTESLVTSETGTTASFTVSLASSPTATVTIQLATSESGEGSLSLSTLTFDASDWNVAQTVTVTGLDDHIVHGNQTYQITGTATSTDAEYDGISMAPVTVTNTEADVAGIKVGPTLLATSETGTSASFNVALTSEPIAPVTIHLGMSIAGQGTLSQSTLTFDAGNWNVAQTVTVTGLDDHIVHGDQTYQITGTATSTDANYDGMAMAPVTVTNTEADVAGIAVTPTKLTTSETGTSASFNVVLTSEPIAPVTISLGMSVAGEGKLSQSFLTFDASDWNVAQTVTVTGLDDHIAHGDQTYQITGTATSTDANYNSMTMTPVTVTNTAADVAGFKVTPATLMTSEIGTSASFNVALTSQPIAPVTISLGMSVPGEGKLSQSSLTFDAGDWNVVQTVTVTGLDDHIVHGNQAYQITGTATSTDAQYGGLSMPPVTVTNTEADVAGITVTPVTGLVTAPGGSVTFTLVLASRPTSTVSIPLVSSNSAAGSVSQSVVVFTSSDWNLPKSVTVSSPKNSGSLNNVTFAIHVGTAISADAVYDGSAANDVAITLQIPLASTLPVPLSPQSAGSGIIPPVPTSGLTSTSGIPGVPTGANSALSAVKKGLPVSAAIASTGGGEEYFEAGGQSWMAQWTPIVANFTINALVSGPRFHFESVPNVDSATPEALVFRLPTFQIVSMPSLAATAEIDRADDLLDVLGDDGARITASEPGLETTLLVGTGFLASSGFVILNSRYGLWLLSLLTARPLWKQFDPLEVLYAWENDDRDFTADDEDEETLMSLVD